MNPRASVKEQTHEPSVSPFEQITALEVEQEKRFQQAQEACAMEELTAQKKLSAGEKVQEVKLREEASEELREYAKNEPTEILRKGDEETSAELVNIDQSFKNQASDLSRRLTQAVQDQTYRLAA